MICSGKSILLKDIVEYVFEKLGLDKNLIVENRDFFRLKRFMEITQKQKKI
jgi:GDPmannose 4,6-dehydratase